MLDVKINSCVDRYPNKAIIADLMMFNTNPFKSTTLIKKKAVFQNTILDGKLNKYVVLLMLLH
jgi:hypothetical protein